MNTKSDQIELRDVVALVALHGLLIQGHTNPAAESYAIADDFLYAREGEARQEVSPAYTSQSVTKTDDDDFPF